MDPALAAIRAAHGTPVDYLPSASAALIPGLNVIWSDVAGEPFQGPGNTTRHISAEIYVGDVPGRPTAQTRLTRKGITWKVIQVGDRDDVEAWVVTLEKA